jgi:hypothetical protein
MATDIIKKYGKDSINEFWNFVEKINFDSSVADAESIKLTLLKQISPTAAERYKDICDDLAHALRNKAGQKNVPIVLYVAYDAVAQGRDFYDVCVQKPATLSVQASQSNALNHFGNIFPTEDDYYGVVAAPETTYTIDDDIDYDDL